MKITLRVYGVLKDVAGTRDTELDVPEGTPLRALPPRLKAHFGEAFYRRIGGEPPFAGLRILVNGSDLSSPDGWETALGEGDLVTILPPTAGG